MTAVDQHTLEIRQIAAQGFHVIKGVDTGPANTSPGDQPDAEAGTQVLLHSSDQLTIGRRVTPDADQLIFTTQNNDDVITLQKYAAKSLGTHVLINGKSRTTLPSTTLLIEINDEKFCIIPASQDQILVIITRGGSDFVQIDDGIESPIVVDTGEGNDYIVSAASTANFSTGPGDDSVTVFQGSSHIETGPGDDMILAKFCADITAYGGPGNDEIVAGGTSFIDGGEGNDSIVGGKGHSILIGGPGDDSIEAGTSSNVIFAGEGSNDVTQLKPNDTTYHNATTELSMKLPASPGK
ncbi:calcium-binding protein [Pseudomonas sp. 1152_12]|uniref:calcium-binding protein n=1 Tax=Pseudomonas sp. 1152_12 TaxID=2604455 RepID=UPI00406318A0